MCNTNAQVLTRPYPPWRAQNGGIDLLRLNLIIPEEQMSIRHLNILGVLAR